MQSHANATRRHVRVGGLVLILLLGAAGCGQSKGTITGKVYYKDKLVKAGTVLFESTDGKSHQTAEIDENGSYTINDMPAGKVNVCVDTSAAKPNPLVSRKRQPDKAPDLPDEAAQNPVYGNRAVKDPKRYTPIPLEYSDPQKTPETFDVTGGKQEYNIRLK